jgi:NADPH-dependent curcumin reductase CurA
MISQYNRMQNPEPIHRMDTLIWKRIRCEGFIVSDDSKKYSAAALQTFSALLQQGKLTYRETVSQGIQSAPKAFVDMLKGGNFGKAVVKVADL